MFFIVLLNVYITNRHETSYNSSCPIKNGMCNLFKIAINIGVIGPFTRVRELYSHNHFPCKILFILYFTVTFPFELVFTNSDRMGHVPVSWIGFVVSEKQSV